MIHQRLSRVLVLSVAASSMALAACSHTGSRIDAGDTIPNGDEAGTTVSPPTRSTGTLPVPAGSGTTMITLPAGLSGGVVTAPGSAAGAAGSSTTTTGVPTAPDSAFCEVVKAKAPKPMDVTDPAAAPVLRQLVDVAPPQVVEQLRFLLDVNVRLERVDPDNTKEIDALAQLYSSGQIERASKAFGEFTISSCGIDLGL